jgi:hypothetical protein
MDNVDSSTKEQRFSKKDLAHRVRIALEKFAQENQYPSDLSGLCSIASIILAKEFISNGSSAKIAYGDVKSSFGHCWVFSSKKHYDVTATQFGYQKILIISDKDLPIYDYIKRHKIDILTKDFQKNFDHWSQKTRPTPENIEKVMKFLI